MKREKPIVGTKYFKSKKELTEYTRELIKNKGTCVIDKYDNDFIFFKELFLRKPCNKDKENLIKLFKISPNPITKDTNHMSYITTYDKEYTFSWKKCCDGKDDDSFDSKLKEALRYCIQDQREECWYDNNTCNICGLQKIDREFQIDHNDTNFCEIVKQFMDIYHGEIPISFDSDTITCQYKFKKEDNIFMLAFQNFHKEKASLQLLCKSCHKKKTYNY